MGFLVKFLRELNSAEGEKFVSLAIVLGLISGFLPSFSIFNLLILFLVFTFRIPIGLYFASWTFFGLVSYLLDPLFAYSGYILLHADVLKGLWTYLYNVPFMRWSGYNNTVILGSFVWGVLIGALFYFVLSKSISAYRNRAFAYFEKSRFLKWIVPKQSKKGILRISGIASFIVIFGALFFILSISVPVVLKYAFEFGVSKMTNQPVEVKYVDVNLKNLSVDFEDVRIGKVKIKKLYSKLSWEYLVWRKFEIEKLLLLDAKYDKNLKNMVFPKSNKPVKALSEKIDIKIPNAEDLIKTANLQTVKKIDKLKKDYKAFMAEINSLKNAANDEKEKINQIKTKIEKLQNRAKNIKNVSDVQAIMADVNALKKDISNIQKDIKDKKNRALNIKKQIYADIKEVKSAVKSDYNNLASKYNMIKNKEYVSFVQTFLEPKINEYVNMAKEGYEKIKPYLKKEKKEQVSRFKGINVKFEDRIKYPDFVLKFSKANLILKDAKFDITLNNLADNQLLYGKTAQMRVDSSSQFYESLNAEVKYFDYIKGLVNLKNLKIVNYKNGDVVVKNILVDAKGNIYIKNGKIDAVMDISGKKPQIKYLASKKIDSLIKGVKLLNVKVHVKGSFEKYAVNIDSNIDKIFANLLNKELKNQIAKQKSKLNKLLSQKQSRELEKLGIDVKNIDDVTKLFSNNENMTQQLRKELEKYAKKSLEKKLLKGGINKFLNF